MASVKLLIKKHNVSKRDGKTSVYIQYNYSRDRRILINTNRRIEIKYWDFENDVLSSSHPKYDSINRHIRKIKLEIETIVSNAQDVGIEPNPEYVLNIYYGFNEEIIITQKKGAERVDTTYKKFELIASHTCRRSFCTNEYLKGTPTLFIMKIRK